jgi:hypothetical protein
MAHQPHVSTGGHGAHVHHHRHRDTTEAQTPATDARWHELEPRDYGAHPRSVPVASQSHFPKHVHAHMPKGIDERFWQMEPAPADARTLRERPPWPPTLLGSRAKEAADAAAFDFGTIEVDTPEAAEAQRRGAARAAPDASHASHAPGYDNSRWWGMEPHQLPEGYRRPPSPPAPPVTLAAEDGRWYRMKPKAIPDDAPHVRAPSPETLARAERDHRGRLIAEGEATPWPERRNEDKWYRLDRHQVYRQQAAWEMPPEVGGYDEWNMCDPADCVKPRYYDQKERWYRMPPVDDGSKYKEPVVEPEPEPQYCRTNARPWEDGSRWCVACFCVASERKRAKDGDALRVC